MTHAGRMLETHPRGAAVEPGPLVACIEACVDCAQSCSACADACLGEEGVQLLVGCIRTCLDCSDICDTTGRVLTRQTGFEAKVAEGVLHACAEACRACGDECERHAGHHEHCRLCAEVCRICREACVGVLAALAA